MSEQEPKRFLFGKLTYACAVAQLDRPVDLQTSFKAALLRRGYYANIEHPVCEQNTPAFTFSLLHSIPFSDVKDVLAELTAHHGQDVCISPECDMKGIPVMTGDRPKNVMANKLIF